MGQAKKPNRVVGGAFAVSMIIGVSILCFMVWYVSPAQLVETVAKADHSLIAIAWAVSLCSTVLRTFRYSLFFPASEHFVRAYSVFSISRVLNLALPFRTGEVAVLAMLKKSNLSPSIAETAPAWLVLRISDAFAISAWFSVIVGMSSFREQYFVLGLAALATSVGLMLVLQFAHRLFPSGVTPSADNWFTHRFVAAIDGLRHIRSATRKAQAIGLSLLIWGALILTSVLTQIAFATPVSPWDAALITALVLGITLLPVNAPMGIGTGDAILTAVMLLVGIPLEQAISLAIGIRLATVSVLLIEGLIGSTLYAISRAATR